MTDTTAPTTVADFMLDNLAEALLEGDDMMAVLDPLAHLMPQVLFVDLCARMDVCPIHLRDLDGCADDENDCPAGRGE